MLAFILGPPRSGTTVLLQALSAHPEVAGLAQEVHTFHHDLGRFSHRVREADHFWLTAADATESLSREYEAALTDAPVRLVKVSTSSIQVDFIRALFPEARFIQILRDPLDVIASMEALRLTFEADQEYPRLLGPAPDPLGLQIAETFEHPHLRAAGAWFFHAVRSESDLRFAGFDTLHRLRYRALVHSPRDVLESALAFLGLGWHEELDSVVDTIGNRPAGPSSLGYSHVEASGDQRIGRYAQTLSPDLVQAIAPLIDTPMRGWGFEPVAAGGDFEAACHHEHIPPAEWDAVIQEATGRAAQELNGFDPARFLFQPDTIEPDCTPLLRTGVVIEHSAVSGEQVATTAVQKQDRRYRFPDPDGGLARLLPTLNGAARWDEIRVSLARADEIGRVLERLHGLALISFA